MEENTRENLVIFKFSLVFTLVKNKKNNNSSCEIYFESDINICLVNNWQLIKNVQCKWYLNCTFFVIVE